MVLIRFFKRQFRAILALLAVAVMLAAAYARVFETLELQTYDWRCKLRGDRPIDERIVFVDIWDDSLEALGAWPFNRGYHAEIIRILSEHGAKAVGFDILFAEPREGDDAVAAAALKAGNVYFVNGFQDIKFEKGRTVGGVPTLMLPKYAQAAKAVGHVNPRSELDGKVRALYPVIEYDGRSYNALSLQIAMDLLGAKDVSQLRLPVDERGCFLVNYAGPWERSFPHYSYLDVLASDPKLGPDKPRMDLEKLRGKICFIGLTSQGSHDTKAIPIQSVYPMVGMHANGLNTVLKNDFIRRVDRANNTLILALLTALVIFLCRWLKPVPALGAVLSVLAGYSLLALLCFFVWGLWLDFFFPFTSLIGIYAIATLSQIITEMRKREVIEKELKIASQIQKSFLPENVPTHPSFEVAVFMKPAKAVGGDLYTFLGLPQDKLGVMLGDVSGKGTPAALFMAKTVSEFKFSARDKLSPAEALSGLNDSIASEATGGLFVTLSYLIFDGARGQALLSNGGHLPAVHVKAAGGSELLSADEGMPIGVMPGVPFDDFKIALAKNDVFALYSDGISEARNRKKDEYGIEALQKTMERSRAQSAEQILGKIVEDVTHFMGKAEQHDDMTLIIIKVKELGTAEKRNS